MNSSMVAVDAAMVTMNSVEMASCCALGALLVAVVVALLLLLLFEEFVVVFAVPALDQMSSPDVDEDQMPRMRVKHCMDVRARVCLSRLLRSFACSAS